MMKKVFLNREILKLENIMESNWNFVEIFFSSPKVFDEKSLF